jgi:hypothetical protein
MPAKRLPLPRRFNAAMSEQAYKQLRSLNKKYGYGNNYLLTILLENFERITDSDAVDSVFSDFAAEYGAPAAGDMKKKAKGP